MNKKIYDAADLMNQYLRLESLFESMGSPNRDILLTISIPDTDLSYTGEFPQVTAKRIVYYKLQSLMEQIKEFQKDEEVFD